MNSLKQYVTRPLAALRHSPWPSPTAIAPRLDASSPIEEENTPYYHTDCFYPAKVGEVLHGRYQIATKLGYGSSSTVWLARDLYRWRWCQERYVALKINSIEHQSRRNAAENELAILQHISQANKRHDGWHFVRRLLGSFTIQAASGKHICLVLEPLREPLWLYCRRFGAGVIPSRLLKVILQMVLHGIDYLHSECQIIHTDLKPDNILVKVEDPAILESAAHDEYASPSPQKVTADCTIYLSRNDFGHLLKPTGMVQISDFGLSVSGKTQQTGCIQAEPYRAPEVILDAGYSYSADIWSLGVLIWELLEGKRLFNPIDEKNGGEYNESLHLAQLTKLLGPPPRAMLSPGRRTALFYKPNGDLKQPELVPDNFDLKNTVSSISGQEKDKFLEFARRMIKWDPEERSTAKELLKDPWLYEDFPSKE